MVAALRCRAAAGCVAFAAMIGLVVIAPCDEIDAEKGDVEAVQNVARVRAKTIGFTVAGLRTGVPGDAYGRARVNRSGRRYASVHVEAWQDNRDRLFAQASGHFLMPQSHG